MQSLRKQKGMSLWSLITVGAIAAFVVILGAKIVPTVVEYYAVKKAVHKAANQGTTKNEIRGIFTKSATVDNIRSIKSKDLEITKDTSGNTVVAFAYDRKIPLVGPASLLLEYEGEGVQGGQ